MDRHLHKLSAQLDEMEQKISFSGRLNSTVSKVPVSWHLAHNLKVINSIITGLEHSEPAAFRKSFSWKKELVYLMRKIPRGRARAPKRVLPDVDISEEELQNEIKITRNRIQKIKDFPKNSFFEHPYFGHINKEETPKFLVIHTEHHLKIIREILGSSKK